MELHDDPFLDPLIHKTNCDYNAYRPAPLYETIDSQDTQPQIESTTKRAQRKANFSVEEDNVLVSAWLTISMDPIDGTDQKGSTFWGRVYAHYEKYKKPNFSVRSVNSLMNLWQMIQKAVNKFNAKVVQVEAKRPSGVTELDKIAEAKILYHALHGSHFNFEHCWITMRCHPKWKTLVAEGVKKVKRKSLSQESSSTPKLIHLGEDDATPATVVDLERPIGKKAQKEREKTRRRQDHMSSHLAEVINDIKEDKKKSQEKRMEERQEIIRLTKERLVFDQERKESDTEANLLKRQRLEMEIMSMDTSNMSPMKKEYFRSCQIEIFEKRRVITEY